MKITPRAREIIKSKMAKRCLAQAELAKAAGVSTRAVSDLLHKGRTSPKSLRQVCEFLGVPTEKVHQYFHRKRGAGA